MGFSGMYHLFNIANWKPLPIEKYQTHAHLLFLKLVIFQFAKLNNQRVKPETWRKIGTLPTNMGNYS